ncbi:hypothetical protein [Cellvibrio sp. KY-YJ-3]|uniref:hypothetical protein n=1 Tax=Cellvibrio sp. KY-YJ-3 TaxID=454662 RepID=UPI0012477143|nr:hypothetical protein [Cellvibrio sp. KY-YJ-3]QEY10850.1 hypothetical protein D0B88_00400 [Cellvibrio sp. KY-YJ-3]
MANTILCVFEGEKREPHYFSSVEEHFFKQEAIIKCSYGNDLYHLLHELQQDDDLDVVELVRESATVPANKDVLAGIERDEIAQVFLFFDMEPQDNHFSLPNLAQMLVKFTEETEHGKLYISYPMVEALRDVATFADFVDLKIAINKCDGATYKQLSESRRQAIPQDYRKISHQNWMDLIRYSLIKSQKITCLEDPDCPSQLQIFVAQSELMERAAEIYVLSAFPLFIREYFGNNVLFE